MPILNSSRHMFAKPKLMKKSSTQPISLHISQLSNLDNGILANFTRFHRNQSMNARSVCGWIIFSITYRMFIAHSWFSTRSTLIRAAALLFRSWHLICRRPTPRLSLNILSASAFDTLQHITLYWLLSLHHYCTCASATAPPSIKILHEWICWFAVRLCQQQNPATSCTLICCSNVARITRAAWLQSQLCKSNQDSHSIL